MSHNPVRLKLSGGIMTDEAKLRYALGLSEAIKSDKTPQMLTTAAQAEGTAKSSQVMWFRSGTNGV